MSNLDEFMIPEHFDMTLVFSNWWTKFLCGVELSGDPKLMKKYFKGVGV